MRNCLSGSRLQFLPLDKIQLVVCEVLPVSVELKIYIKYQCSKTEQGSSVFQVRVCVWVYHINYKLVGETRTTLCSSIPCITVISSCPVRADPCSEELSVVYRQNHRTSKDAGTIFPVSGSDRNRGNISWPLTVVKYSLYSTVMLCGVSSGVKCCTITEQLKCNSQILFLGLCIAAFQPAKTDAGFYLLSEEFLVCVG